MVSEYIVVIRLSIIFFSYRQAVPNEHNKCQDSLQKKHDIFRHHHVMIYVQRVVPNEREKTRIPTKCHGSIHILKFGNVQISKQEKTLPSGI